MHENIRVDDDLAEDGERQREYYRRPYRGGVGGVRGEAVGVEDVSRIHIAASDGDRWELSSLQDISCQSHISHWFHASYGYGFCWALFASLTNAPSNSPAKLFTSSSFSVSGMSVFAHIIFSAAGVSCSTV